MRKKLVALILVMFIAFSAWGFSPKPGRNVISANILGPFLGLYAVTLERVVAPDLGIVVAPIYFNLRYSLFRPLVDPQVVAWYGGLRAGVHYYPNDTAPGGVVFGLYMQAGMMQLSDGTLTASGGFLAPAAMIGYRFFIGQLGIAPRVRFGYALPLFEHESIVVGDELLYAPTSFNWEFAIGLSWAF